MTPVKSVAGSATGLRGGEPSGAEDLPARATRVRLIHQLVGLEIVFRDAGIVPPREEVLVEEVVEPPGSGHSLPLP
jgi:hypothetical protein